MIDKDTSRDIMDIKELADYLQIHPATVYKYARKGKIPAFKIGYDWRFHKKLIDKWILEKVDYNSNKKERRKD
ncbi:helix-turn-helix domain-containing protein [Candidatus Omnitrophota bacterium]